MTPGRPRRDEPLTEPVSVGYGPRDLEAEQALEILRDRGGKARLGHKTRPAGGKLAREVVDRLVARGAAYVKGPFVYLVRTALS